MDTVRRIEWVLAEALAEVDHPGAPRSLAAALKHAVFPGGARIRPRLCLAVAMACGDDCAPLSNATAAAIELMHCASLVHDDLPCFDNADMRRGQPSVHKAFGERLAVLAGDALIVLAYQTLSADIHHRPALGPCCVVYRKQSVCRLASLQGRLGKASRSSTCGNISVQKQVLCLQLRLRSVLPRLGSRLKTGRHWATGLARPIKSPTIFAM